MLRCYIKRTEEECIKYGEVVFRMGNGMAGKKETISEGIYICNLSDYNDQSFNTNIWGKGDIQHL